MKENARLSSLNFNAVIFDMDGVVTRTAKIDPAVWRSRSYDPVSLDFVNHCDRKDFKK